MEWPFLRKMLVALGFAYGWVKLIIECVTTISYNIMINGVNGGHVIPSRGLRHRDILSPYLFIIYVEGLSLLLQQAQYLGSIHGCRVARGALAISHLFFVDDSLLFFKANALEAGVIKQCFHTYECLSGQTVNFHKSNLLGVSKATNFGKYLGKEVLLKSVVQAMPTFSMSVFLLPDSLCKVLERVMNRFWWGSGGSTKRGIHWMAWDRLCIPKKFGSLGFKDLCAFNLAMLWKQGWRFLTKPQSLASRIYKARYFLNSSFIDATLGNRPSFCWRSIMASHTLIYSGVRCRIDNGTSNLVWGDPWLSGDPNPMVQSLMPPHLSGTTVAGLIDQIVQTYDVPLLHEIFLPTDIGRILRLPLSPTYEDSWFWYGDPKGCYSVIIFVTI
ncbi:uncharacterized protein LOC116015781 [Ipomoea triloba]|uniref:uncharacterized protein LOC116015781 n=1 Tax=Ipomoea triloba TaxID=35885 RepID=UPI00125D9CAF|nr:uncharacterized protein LOC116015781 [Ipomoea triloba]